MKEEVYQKALECFYEHSLQTKENSILIFISLLEKRVEIVSNKEIDKSERQKIENGLKEKRQIFKRNDYKTGIKEISKNLFSESLPPQQERSELSDQVVPENDKKSSLTSD